MKKYMDRETAPLVFHNFNRFFRLPIGILYSAALLLISLFSHESHSSLYTVILSFLWLSYGVALVLQLLAFIGFFRWRTYAWRCFVVYCYLELVVNGFVCLDSIIGPSDFWDNFPRSLGVALADVLMLVYYYKRRLLFTSGPSSNGRSAASSTAYEPMAAAPGRNTSFSASAVYVCPACDQDIAARPGLQLYCPNCGRSLKQLTISPSGWASLREEQRILIRQSVAEDGSPGSSSPDPVVPPKDDELPPILRRAFLLAEDEEWEKAAHYFDDFLDSEPENAYGYLGKLLAENHIKDLSSLGKIPALTENKLYIRALKYANDDIKTQLLSCAEAGRNSQAVERASAENKDREDFSTGTGCFMVFIFALVFFLLLMILVFMSDLLKIL